MNYLAHNLRNFVREQGGEQAAAAKIGVNQATVNRIVKPDSSKPIQNPSQTTLQKIAKALKATIHDIINRDLSIPIPASHPSGLDIDRLGYALTSFDKALKDKKIRGRMGQMRKTFAAAYAMAGFFSDLSDPNQLNAYDRMVLQELIGEIDEQRSDGITEGSPKGDSGTTARKAQAGSRGK